MPVLWRQMYIFDIIPHMTNSFIFWTDLKGRDLDRWQNGFKRWVGWVLMGFGFLFLSLCELTVRSWKLWASSQCCVFGSHSVKTELGSSETAININELAFESSRVSCRTSALQHISQWYSCAVVFQAQVCPESMSTWSTWVVISYVSQASEALFLSWAVDR